MGSGLVCSDGAANSGGAAAGAAELSAEDRGRCPPVAAPLRSTGRRDPCPPTLPQQNAERGLCSSLNNGINPSASPLVFFYFLSLKRNKPKKRPKSAAFSFHLEVIVRRKMEGGGEGGHYISARSVLRFQLLLFCDRGWAENFHPGHSLFPVPLVGRITPKTERERDGERGGEKPPCADRRSVQAGPPPLAGQCVSPRIAPHLPIEPR